MPPSPPSPTRARRQRTVSSELADHLDNAVDQHTCIEWSATSDEAHNVSYPDPRDVHTCSECEITEAELGQRLKCCSRCLVAMYCSDTCQRTHYKYHKHECAELAELGLQSGPLRQDARATHLRTVQWHRAQIFSGNIAFAVCHLFLTRHAEPTTTALVLDIALCQHDHGPRPHVHSTLSLDTFDKLRIEWRMNDDDLETYAETKSQGCAVIVHVLTSGRGFVSKRHTCRYHLCSYAHTPVTDLSLARDAVKGIIMSAQSEDILAEVEAGTAAIRVCHYERSEINSRQRRWLDTRPLRLRCIALLAFTSAHSPLVDHRTHAIVLTLGSGPKALSISLQSIDSVIEEQRKACPTSQGAKCGKHEAIFASHALVRGHRALFVLKTNGRKEHQYFALGGMLGPPHPVGARKLCPPGCDLACAVKLLNAGDADAHRCVGHIKTGSVVPCTK